MLNLKVFLSTFVKNNNWNVFFYFKSFRNIMGRIKKRENITYYRNICLFSDLEFSDLDSKQSYITYRILRILFKP